MSAVTSLGRLSYASFYLPPLTFGYLSFEDNNPLLTYLTQIHINIPIQGLEPIYVFWFLTAFTFLGGMQVHGVSRTIYGLGGPEERPKQKSVQIRHSLAFALGTDAENIPVVPCRLAHSNISRELVKDVVNGRNRLKTGLIQLREIGLMFTWSKVPRFMYFIPMGLHRFLGRVAFVVLGVALYLGAGSYAAFVLFAALFVLLFRKVIWAPLPPVFNTDALEDKFSPEYQLHDADREELSRPRIQTGESE